MMEIHCPSCRARVDDAPDDAVSARGVVCPSCGSLWAFRRTPLFVLTGASGAGKTTIAHELTGTMDDVLLLEQDLFWWGPFTDPADDYANLGNVCLNIAFYLAQNGRPVVLVGSCMPNRYETRARRRFFSDTHYLALVCGDDELRARLDARGDGYWREQLPAMLEWNAMLRSGVTTNDKPITLIDTTGRTPGETAAEARAWIAARLSFGA